MAMKPTMDPNSVFVRGGLPLAVESITFSLSVRVGVRVGFAVGSLELRPAPRMDCGRRRVVETTFGAIMLTTGCAAPASFLRLGALVLHYVGHVHFLSSIPRPKNSAEQRGANQRRDPQDLKFMREDSCVNEPRGHTHRSRRKQTTSAPIHLNPFSVVSLPALRRHGSHEAMQHPVRSE